ncbi:MAG: hypothetical protein J6A01_11015 [Proteobacteria bacterium]|nr:hypothetical protein [Pseudomonadota bacterium]
MNHKFLFCLIIALGISAGCDSHDASPATIGNCNAAYVVEDNGRVCYLGECPKYNNDLRNHNCPENIPLCIQDEDGHYYCGTYCPAGMREFMDTKNNMSICQKRSDTPTDNCSPSDCLAQKGHEAWAEAECTDDGSCKLVACRNGYTLQNNECVIALNCCGDACIDCPKGEGWKSGECRDGKCVADSCDDGFVLSQKKDGSVGCEEKIVRECNRDSDCLLEEVCDIGKGMCFCRDGLTDCGNVCRDLSNDNEHCGACNHACNVEHGSGYCDKGVCRVSCEAGYMLSSDGLRCIKEGAQCSNVGEYECADDDNIVVQKCNENHKWEEIRTCYLDWGTWRGAFCSGEYCEVRCTDDYIQNTDKTLCEPRTTPCTNGEKRCNDKGVDIEYLICKNNKWVTEKECKYENAWMLYCHEDTGCEFDCTKGYKLNAEGTQCEFDSEDTCTNGETRCGGTEVHRCENNHWTVVEVCDLRGPHGGGVSCNDQTGCNYWCFDDLVLCGNACADLKKDFDHCGDCDTVCESGSCVNGTCK